MKSGDALQLAVKLTFLALLTLIVLAGIGFAYVLLIFYVPVVLWLVWSNYNKTAELERRLAALEKHETQSEEA
jgi:hypothetical protein